MNYTSAQIGRVFMAAFSDGDDILPGLKDIFIKESVEAAVFFLIGAVKEGRLVAGPQKDVIPPEPYWRGIDESHEILGMGNILNSSEGPKIHLHAALGKKEMVKMGCLREFAKTFLIAEAVIIELNGSGASRVFDPATGLFPINFPK